jgi:peptidoglycan/LPS O-acetylase OafA/YrhL
LGKHGESGTGARLIGYSFCYWIGEDDDAKSPSEQAMVADQSHNRLSGGVPDASNRQLPSLTPLRGIAALWVVFYHFCGTAQYLPNLGITPHSYLISKGYLAVDMFFILSGLVMTHVYHRAFSESIGQHYRSFLVARIARLYPLHVFILLLFVLTATAAQLMSGLATGSFESIPLTGPRSVGAIIANMLMLQGLAASELSWNYPAWSISVEFFAYMAFPFALPVIARAPYAVRVLLGAVLFATLIWLAAHTKGDFDQWDGPITLVRCMPEFFLGTLLYFVFRDYGQTTWLSRDLPLLAVLAATLAGLHFGVHDLLIIFLFSALVLLAVSNSGAFAKLLNIGPLIWLGEISYSLYLLHGLVQFSATKGLDAIGIRHTAALSSGQSLALMMMMLAICVFGASATYWGIENVWRRHLRTLLGGVQKIKFARAVRSERA